MERLSTQPASQDTSGCIALCYQLNQPISVQAAIDNQTAVAVQSLIDSQVVTEAQDEEEDIFQCGKCKKQFNSLATFVSHKQTQCVLQQQIQQQPQQQQQLTIGTGANGFTSTINLNRTFNQAQINGSVANINSSGPILQAHPCLTRSLNQPAAPQTLTLGGVPSSPISQLSQNMVFTDELMALTGLDPNTLSGPTIQMVTTPIGGQTPSHSSGAAGVTIFSPITSLTRTANTFTAGAGPPTAGQLQLVQPTQQITLTAITDTKTQTLQQQQSHQQHIQPQPLQPQTQLQPQAQQQTILAQAMPPPPQPPTQTNIAITPATQQSIQPQIFKPSPTKAGRKSAQNNFITVLNSETNSVSLLSTRKGKTRNANNSGMMSAEETNTKTKLQCDYCNKHFTKNFDLQQHLRAHTGEKPFQCIVCGRAFTQKSNVKKHMATHKVWPCGTSNTLPKQPDPEMLDATDNTGTAAAEKEKDKEVVIQPEANKEKIQSLLTAEGADGKKVNVKVDNSYICQYCPAKFKSYYQLKTHLVTHKNEQVYKCVVKKCGLSFHDLEAFLGHIKSHETEMNYRCHQCHKYFKTLSELGVHQYSHVYLNQSVKSGPRHFQCTKCGNKYTTPEALEHHMSTTSHDYRCPHCEKIFTCERFLRRHLPIHGSEGQFRCKECGKVFKTEHYLKSHHLIHTGETPYPCTICPAAFNRKDKLKRHMSIHNPVMKYRCPFRSITGCAKEFSRPDKLKAHIITHSGIKPYNCSICGKKFSRRAHMLEHERGHRADYRFKCEKCGKGFFRPKLFAEHKCQPSKEGVEQKFRPREKKKLGRPKKRMITITPDSLAKSRGKQYPSRTRGKSTVLNASNYPMIERHLASRQKKADAEKKAKVEKMDEEVTNSQTIAVEVVKALPILTATSVDGDSKNLGNASMGQDSLRMQIIPAGDGTLVSSGNEVLSPQIQQISLGHGGELVDHYVVHLTESVDGSAPTIQTAFIPAGVTNGGQIFASGPGGMGIQPITIIEASSLQMDPTGTQIIASTDVMSAQQGEAALRHLAKSVASSAETGQHQVQTVGLSDDGNGNRLKLEVEECPGTILSSSATSSTDVLVGGASHSGGGTKEDVVMVMGNEGEGILSVGGTEMVVGEEEGDMNNMMDTSLSFFPPPSSEGYPERQVVVSGGQAFITCTSQLDTGLGS